LRKARESPPASWNDEAKSLARGAAWRQARSTIFAVSLCGSARVRMAAPRG
jgi:hypothetical protein